MWSLLRCLNLGREKVLIEIEFELIRKLRQCMSVCMYVLGEVTFLTGAHTCFFFSGYIWWYKSGIKKVVRSDCKYTLSDCHLFMLKFYLPNSVGIISLVVPLGNRIYGWIFFQRIAYLHRIQLRFAYVISGFTCNQVWCSVKLEKLF